MGARGPERACLRLLAPSSAQNRPGAEAGQLGTSKESAGPAGERLPSAAAGQGIPEEMV